MSFVVEDKIDPGCYWHGTIEELCEEPGQCMPLHSLALFNQDQWVFARFGRR